MARPLCTALVTVSVACVTPLGFGGEHHSGVPRHRYSFTSDASDSIGGFHGTPHGNVTFESGQAVLNGNMGLQCGAAAAAYIDLPNGIVSHLETSDVTFEAWVTWEGQNFQWQRIFEFGMSDGGEGSCSTARFTNWICLGPQGGSGGALYGEYSPNGLDAAPGAIQVPPDAANPLSGSSLPTGSEQHVVMVLNGDDGLETLYLNGVKFTSRSLGYPLDLSIFDDRNNWIGRAQWSVNGMFPGSISEFRVYDYALTPEEVHTSFQIGPQALPLNIVAPTDLTCVPLPEHEILVSWTNGEAYDRVEVYRDGTDPENVLDSAVTGESYVDAAAGFDVHSYFIRGVKNGAFSSLVGPCQAAAASDFFVHVSNLLARNDETCTAQVTLDFDYFTDDPPLGEVQGWQYGICHEASIATALTATLASDTAGLKGGAGPDFSSLDVHPDGVTVGIVVDMQNSTTVSPQNGWRDALIEYRLSSSEIDCTEGPRSVTSRLSLCNTLGSPAINSIVSVEGQSLPAGGSDGGLVTIACPVDFHASLSDAEADIGGLVEVEVTLDFDHEGNTPDSIRGWSYGVCHDPAMLQGLASSPAGRAWREDTAALNGGAGPGYFNMMVFEGGITVAVIVDLAQVVTIPPVNGWRDVVLSYSAIGGPLDCLDGSAEPVVTEVSLCESLGSPPVRNVMTVGLVSIPMGGYDPASVTISCSTYFVRGDANQDGTLDISDPIGILAHLFSGAPVTCNDAVDSNDDGQIDISDAIYMLAHLFAGGPDPKPPYPQIGPDLTPDTIDCEHYGAGR